MVLDRSGAVCYAKRVQPFPTRSRFLLVALLFASASHVFAAAGDVYVSSTDVIYKLAAADGSKTTFASALDVASDLTFDRRGNLYVSEYGSARITKIAPNGAKTIFAQGLGKPGALTFDAAGNLFVADGAAKAIYKLTPAAVKTTFATGISAQGLAFDAAGNLYATDYDTNTIAKFTSAGARTTYATGMNNPTDLAFDASGNLFAANLGASTVDKFTPGGVRTVFTTSVNQPTGLGFDRAGNLFVANQGNQAMGKFLPTGAVTTFATNLGLPFGVAVEPLYGLALNIATRVRVQTGDNTLIGGFIITGTQSKKIIIRAIGPSLSFQGIPGALQDPVLEVYNSSNQLLAMNDSWRATQEALIKETGVAPTDDREAAGVFTLPPGNYTAVVRGKGSDTGLGLVEVYDLDQAADSELANISTRGRVETGDNVMIAGFIIGANGGRVMLRALGPSLASAVPGTLPDPKISLRDANGVEIARNNDWKVSSQQAEIAATGIAPTNDKEAAVVATLAPGNYTAIESDFNNATGVGLVELYKLP